MQNGSYITAMISDNEMLFKLSL